MVSSHSISMNFLRVEGLSTDLRVLGRHTMVSDIISKNIKVLRINLESIKVKRHKYSLLTFFLPL